ncbi:MAG: hypothetical protein CMI16_02935 [Opitutaceae bacterium]|nr:hypothetical protein [Opitutaceae bacterium]
MSRVQILQKYWQEDPHVLRLLRHAIHVSLCAGYDTANYKSPVRQCVQLYHTLQSPHRDDDPTFCEWMRKNTYVAFFALKAFLLYMMRQDPALESVVRTTYQWESFERVVAATNDHVRQKLTERGVCVDLDNEMRRLHDNELPFLYKLQKGSERDMISAFVAQRSELDIVRSIASSHDDSDRARHNAELHTKFQHLCMFLPHSPLFPIEWSEQIGLNEHSSRILCEIAQLYHEGKPCNSGMRLLGQIAADDFHKLTVLSIVLNKTSTIRIYQLPSVFVEQQLRCARATHRDTVRHFCITCGQVSCVTTTVGTSAKKRKLSASNVFAEGQSKVIYDVVEDKIACCRKKASQDTTRINHITDLRDVVVNSKRHNDTDAACVDFYFDTERLCGKVSKAERKRQASGCCVNDELQRVDMLGKVLCIGKKQYLLCPNCGIMCEFEFCLHGIADESRGTVSHPFHEALWATPSGEAGGEAGDGGGGGESAAGASSASSSSPPPPATANERSDFVIACGLCNLRFPCA